MSFVFWQVSFIASQTRESCSKTGKHLLGTISSYHPFVISVLLESVSTTIQVIGKVRMFLFWCFLLFSFPIHIVLGWDSMIYTVL